MLPETVRNEKGDLKLDPVKVKHIWANYIRRLGSEPNIVLKDTGDRAEFDDPFAKKVADYVRKSLSPNGSLSEGEPNHLGGIDHIPNEILRLAGLGLKLCLRC